jgi:serine protease AprX
VVRIPDFVVEFFLLGRTRREAIERYTQDGGIVTDVWLAFAKDLDAPRRVLVAPTKGTSAVDVGYALHTAITSYRAVLPAVDPVRPFRGKPGVSPLENFVAVTIYFDELLRIVLPMTNWWHDKNLSAVRRKATRSGPMLEDMLEQAIRNKLGREENEVGLRQSIADSADVYPDRRVIQAASLAALIGVFLSAQQNPAFLDGLAGLNPRTPEGEERFVVWVNSHAETIAREARNELARPFVMALLMLPKDMPGSRPPGTQTDEPPVLVQRVFLDRDATLADTSAICTIKADAAYRVFDISCRDVTWAVIDSGIATSHPAFEDHDAKDPRGQAIVPPPQRIKATYDFTRIERIRNFDLIAEPEGSPGRQAAIEEVVVELENLPGRAVPANFHQDAVRHLESIARQLEQRVPPDWGLIEPLIRWVENDNGVNLVSDHGTHVGGILAGDWRSPTPGPDGRREVLLRGVCRDLNLYDLRVIHPANRKSTEFAILAALEFVQFVNARSAGEGPVVHGVNISLSIPHDVRNYGCGATPICVACDRVVNSGVVVVAAAGNRGWNEQEIGFGNFVFCSITDPGNAREVITVGSTHRLKPHTFGVSYFSSRGPTGDGRIKPDLVAPGEQIRGPIRGGADDELDGTSMAAPFVSGAAAMLIARHRELIGSPKRVKQILCDNATDLGRERYFQGHGLLDVLRALQAV